MDSRYCDLCHVLRAVTQSAGQYSQLSCGHVYDAATGDSMPYEEFELL